MRATRLLVLLLCLATRVNGGETVAPTRVDVPLLAARPALSAARRARLERQAARVHRHGPRRQRAAGLVPAPVSSAVPQGAVPASAFEVIRRTDLAGTIPVASLIDEPCVAQNGRDVFLTGNWFGAVSKDSGQSFAWVDPFSAFPSVNDGFCCDQTTLYDPSRDLFLWLLSYSPDASNNTVRLAVAHGQAELEAGNWFLYDFASPAGSWFDYPQMALGTNSLYVTTNLFRVSDDEWASTRVIRLSLDQIAAHASLAVDTYSSADHFNFTLVRGAGTTMYWASQDDSASRTRVYRWSEGTASGAVAFDDVDVNAWGVAPMACAGPDGRNWCDRADDRVMTGWVAGGVLGFMWNASQDASHPWPYVRVVRLTEATRALVDQPDMVSPDHALLFPAAAVNARGHLAGTLVLGGGALYPSVGAFVLDDLSAPPPPWEIYTLAAGESGPAQDQWGDYLCTAPASPVSTQWVASGFVLAGGSTTSHLHPQYFLLGRERDVAPCGADGDACSDANACTPDDTCHAALCLATATLTCTPPDDCHTAGRCDPASGACLNPAKPDGTPCAAPNACTRGAACVAGACLPSDVVSCGEPVACHEPGVCDPTSGRCTTPPVTAASLRALLGVAFTEASCANTQERRLVTQIANRLHQARTKLDRATRAETKGTKTKTFVKQTATLLTAAAHQATHHHRNVSNACTRTLTKYVDARRKRAACLL